MTDDFSQYADLSAKRDDITAIKGELEILSKKLFELQNKKIEVEARFEYELEQTLLPVKSELRDVEGRIRSLWGPYIAGAEESSIDFGDVKLEAKEIITIKIEDKDVVIDWFEHNGFKDCMKWDIHTEKAKSIIKDHLKKTGEEIHGSSYSTFTKIVTKPSKPLKRK